MIRNTLNDASLTATTTNWINNGVPARDPWNEAWNDAVREMNRIMSARYDEPYKAPPNRHQRRAAEARKRRRS